MLLKTLLTLQATQTGFDMRHVLAINVPEMPYGKTPEQITAFYQETVRRVSALPGVNGVAVGSAVPWRDVLLRGHALARRRLRHGPQRTK